MAIELKPIRRLFYGSPESSFQFGGYAVEATAILRPTSRRNRQASQFALTANDGSRSQSSLEFVGQPPGFRLMAGIDGDVDSRPFRVARVGPRLRRRNRRVTVSGAVELVATSSRGKVSITRGSEDGVALWSSERDMGALSEVASLEEAAVVCALVVNSIAESTSLWRILNWA